MFVVCWLLLCVRWLSCVVCLNGLLGVGGCLLLVDCCLLCGSVCGAVCFWLVDVRL